MIIHYRYRLKYYFRYTVFQRFFFVFCVVMHIFHFYFNNLSSSCNKITNFDAKSEHIFSNWENLLQSLSCGPFKSIRSINIVYLSKSLHPLLYLFFKSSIEYCIIKRWRIAILSNVCGFLFTNIIYKLYRQKYVKS